MKFKDHLLNEGFKFKKKEKVWFTDEDGGEHEATILSAFKEKGLGNYYMIDVAGQDHRVSEDELEKM